MSVMATDIVYGHGQAACIFNACDVNISDQLKAWKRMVSDDPVFLPLQLACDLQVESMRSFDMPKKYILPGAKHANQTK